MQVSLVNEKKNLNQPLFSVPNDIYIGKIRTKNVQLWFTLIVLLTLTNIYKEKKINTWRL